MTSNLPIEHQHWSSAECAKYWGVSAPEFLRKTRHQDGFPKPLPAFTGHPRWAAVDVINFAMKRTDQ